jgi:hypothetical protein
MKREKYFVSLLAVLAALLTPAVGYAGLSTQISLPLQPAYHDGKLAYFLSLEFSDQELAKQHNAVWAPPLKAAKVEGTEELFVFTNGLPGQADVIESIPGTGDNDDYSPIWRMVSVTWKESVAAADRKVVKSAAEVDELITAGKLEEKDSGAVFNCPVVLVNVNDDGSGGVLAPTLKMGEQVVGFEADTVKGERRVVLKVEPGWGAGRQYGFLSLEHAAKAVLPELTGIATVRKLGLDKIGEEATADFFVVVGADGKPTQALPVLEAVPGQAGYSPVWHIDIVQWVQGKQPRELHSADEIDQAKSAGEVTVTESDPEAVFNCPVVAIE